MLILSYHYLALSCLAGPSLLDSGKTALLILEMGNMMKRRMSLWMTGYLVLSVLLTSCSQQNYESQIALMAGTGLIQTDCIVKYYKSNGSAYITRQQHGYNPSEFIFQSVSNEPIGAIECVLRREQFSYSGPQDESLSDLPEEFWNKYLAASVFYSFCAGGDLVDISSMIAGDNTKIEGQWYRPYTPSWPSDIQITLYQSLDTGRIELVKMIYAQHELVWMLESYNYRYSKELEKTLPRRIDVFDISGGIASKSLMVRFDYMDIRRKITQVVSDQ